MALEVSIDGTVRLLDESVLEDMQRWIDLAREAGCNVQFRYVDVDILSADHFSMRRENEYQQARVRAQELLMEHLDDSQKHEYERSGRFRIHKGRWWFKRTYTLSRATGVTRTMGGKTTRYCIDFAGDSYMIPKDDLLLALKLLIDTNEAGFLMTANARQQ